MNYQNGPQEMPRVPRLPDAVIECLIMHSMFRELANRYVGEDRDRLFGLIHDVAEEVLARVELPKADPAKPSVDLVEAIKGLTRYHLVDPQEGEADMDEAEDGWWVKFDDLAALVAAHKEGK